jgi:hypothetical protein
VDLPQPLRNASRAVMVALAMAMLAACTPGGDPAGTPPASQAAPPSAHPRDYLMFSQPGWELRLAAIVLVEGGVRLEVDYKNVASAARPLQCDDATGGSFIRFADRTIPMSDGYCAQHLGQPITIEPGGTLHSWGFFPVQARTGDKFAISWWNWGVTPMDIPMP